jgi:hypothetical protein
MTKVLGNRHWIQFLLLAAAVLAAGCSDDDPVTPPPVDPDPSSSVFQISTFRDGTALAAGREGDAGKLYSNSGGTWTLYDNQPDGTTFTGVMVDQYITDPPGTQLYVFARPSGIQHVEQGRWVDEFMEATPAGGLLKKTATDRWCLGQGGILLGESAGQWSPVLETDDADSELTDVAESPDGSLFVSQYFTDQDFGRIHRFTAENNYQAVDVQAQVYALAATTTDTVWAAGNRLLRFADASWDTVISIPNDDLVVAIGQPGDGSLTLVCEKGAIYRWRNDELTVEQAFNLNGPLASVCYFDEDTIYGSMNFIEPNTGHLTGIIVRYNGVQWITDFLAPPS